MSNRDDVLLQLANAFGVTYERLTFDFGDRCLSPTHTAVILRLEITSQNADMQQSQWLGSDIESFIICDHRPIKIRPLCYALWIEHFSGNDLVDVLVDIGEELRLAAVTYSCSIEWDFTDIDGNRINTMQ
ncbi:hypothetical protein [Shewanella sp.]|uniref:hypothetical protein n=1 Tax=Shewanella sp. TaxID=50422 RepID=UPI003D0E015A